MRNKRILSVLLAIIMVFTMIPMTAFSKEQVSEDCVYLSISYDGEYIEDKNGNPIVYLPISLKDIAEIDLTEYGLDNMLYDADGDGEYETTALQLLIYAHEELYGGDWSEVNFDALPGSSYFKGGIFGFTENLMYFHNGDFPVDESQSSEWMTVGATSDRIVLEAGDFLDVASFECFSFLWDQLGGFHFFADNEGNILHEFEAEASETLSVKLMHSFCDLMYGQSYLYGASDYEVYYGKQYGAVEGTSTADGDGNVDIAIDEPGTYYLWCYGANGSDDGTHGSCDHYNETGEPCIVSAPAYAKLVVKGEVENPAAPETPEVREPQDVSAVLNATMAQMAATVTAPAFGTNAGEWTVFSLARGEYFETSNEYFTNYYERIVKTVNETAASVNLNGALDKNKSTENSRLIVALSSIGKNATSVGDWNLVEAYDANGINWIKKQGLNGTIWTLIALDSGAYETDDETLRQQCVDSILDARHNDGGWSLVTAKAEPSNVDITSMTLTALYPYRDQPEVAEACENAIEWLSNAQLTTGGFPYGNGETSESCAWAIVALTTWGINPDTDARFIKDGKSAVDNLLTYYIEEEAMFAHQGTESNNMATDQACYALVAYNRLLNNENALYDCSDVEFESAGDDDSEGVVSDGKMEVSLVVPKKISSTAKSFKAVLSIDEWDNEAGYKLIDFIMTVPDGVSVNEVTAGESLNGGEVKYNLEAVEGDSNKLRVVYFDANNNSNITMSGSNFPATIFTVKFAVDDISEMDELELEITGMSVKLSSDSSDEASQIIVDSKNACGSILVTGERILLHAIELYTGDGVDLIPSDKKAVAIALDGDGVEEGSSVVYRDGSNTIEFLYSADISEETDMLSYVALVDASVSMKNIGNLDYYNISEDAPDTITFGDSNEDGVVNAQDALAVVDAWLRKGDAPTDDQILALNVNGDARLNTFDALGIVEAFVNDSKFNVVVKAAKLDGDED